MPSAREGFGLVYLEAMRAGKPCIAAHGAADEIITDGVDGVLIADHEAGRLAAAIVSLFTDDGARKRMGTAARKCVNDRFTEDQFGRRLRTALTPPGEADSDGGMNILGLNAYHGDVSAALVRDGQLSRRSKKSASAASSIARDSRRRHRVVPADGRRRRRADVDLFAVSRDPHAHLWRRACSRFAIGRSGPSAIARATGCGSSAAGDDRARRSASTSARPAARTRFVEHHPAHLASAVFVSPVRRCRGLRDRRLRRLRQHVVGPRRGQRADGRRSRLLPALARPALPRRHAVPRLPELRRRIQGDGPRAVRRAAFTREIEPLVRLERRRPLRPRSSYFRHWSDGVQMTWDDGEPTIGRVFTPKLEALLGPARRADEPLDARHEAIAASLQAVFEDAALHVLRHVQRATGSTALCLAGGCAMNSVANGKIRAHTAFQRRLHSASGRRQRHRARRGVSRLAPIGRQRRVTSSCAHGYWGPEFDDAEIAAALDARGTRHRGAPAAARRVATTSARSCDGRRGRSPTAASSAGFRGGWNGAPARSAIAASSPIRGAPTCATSSTRRSSSASASGRSRRRCWRRRSTTYFVGAVPDPFMMQVYPVRRGQARGHAGGHARRWLGPAADGEPRIEPALLAA